MGRRLLHAGVMALALGALLFGGCAAKGHARVRSGDTPPASDDTPTNAWDSTSASATTPAPTEAAPTGSAPAPSAAPAPTASAEPAKPMPGCSLVCNVANKGRVPSAEEGRLTQALADVTQALHRCVAGRIPSLTLRFDSTAKLTGFGVDHDSERESSGTDSCIDSVNQRMPAVSYSGPATMRCSEHCGR